MTTPATPDSQSTDTQHNSLASLVKSLSAPAAAAILEQHPAAVIAAVLGDLNAAFTQDILAELPRGLVDGVMNVVPIETARQWSRNQSYAEGCIGRMMEPALAVFPPDMTVAQAVAELRTLVKVAFITYGYITDPTGKLLGVITMRDLLFADDNTRLDTLMLRDAFALTPELPLSDAMKLVLDRHYPVYPVCDAQGVLVGLVRGQAMFEEQAFDITAQAGTMVGVEKEERLATRWSQSFKFRHPWLQLNLLTAFAAGAVVGIFEGTVEKLVVLAAFLPVLAGQSGNTGCQALAVTLRGLTLGELKPGSERTLVMKEALLGMLNGASTGLIAALGMFTYATIQGSPHALMLAAVVWLALVGACVVSGICGAMIPLTLKRFGADPATASSIFLTTATDVVSMGLLLGLATLLVR
ncbi:MAG: magnesium transporter [Burkholderiales bacterium]